VVRERSAKPLCVGSIPTRASSILPAEIAGFLVPAMPYQARTFQTLHEKQKLQFVALVQAKGFNGLTPLHCFRPKLPPQAKKTSSSLRKCNDSLVGIENLPTVRICRAARCPVTLRPLICYVLSLLRIHCRDCKYCAARLTCRIELRSENGWKSRTGGRCPIRPSVGAA
jgi:hypothetical protein